MRRFLDLSNASCRCCVLMRTCATGHKVKEFAQVAVGSRDAAPSANQPHSKQSLSLDSTSSSHPWSHFSPLRLLCVRLLVCCSGYPCPPYKIIILDEADSMTKDAQSALRRTMEQYTRVTRFCLICNYVSRIIDPIKSRCAKFRYQPLAPHAMKQRLAYIAQQEHISIDEQQHADAEGEAAPLDLLCQLSGGDMRQSITLMQSAARLLTPSPASALLAPSSKRTLTSSLIRDVATLTPPAFIARFHGALLSNSFDAMQCVVSDMISEGFDSQSVLQAWLLTLMADGSISEDRKAAACMHIAVVEKRLLDGGDEYLQMLDLAATARKHIHKPNASQ